MAAAIWVAALWLGIGLEARAQSRSWTWIGGSATLPSYVIGAAGLCGTAGAPASSSVPGGRSHASSWMDNEGRLWLFGGYGYDCAGNAGSLNDVWQFDPQTQHWTLIGGVATVSGNGGAAGIYGKQGAAAAANIPGGRDSASSWTDSDGHFWLFGGYGFDAGGAFGSLNDLWEFDPSTGQWTWIAGSQAVGGADGQPGVYGSLGIASPVTTPGGRGGACTWTDQNGGLWLFGGSGLDANGALGELNDLWRFDRSTGEWAWEAGSSALPSGSAGQPGVYGALAVPAPANAPGGRDRASTWVDSGGNLWLFGGYGYDANGKVGLLNDLWEFNPSSAEWAWMGGSQTVGTLGGVEGIYGSRGASSRANAPGSREGAGSWMDGGGNLWLFGGDGFDSEGNQGALNDLWEFNPVSQQWTWLGGSSTVPRNSGLAGQYGEAGAASEANAPGGRTGSLFWRDQQGNAWLFGGYGMDATQKDGELDDLWVFAQNTSGSDGSASGSYSLVATSMTLQQGASGSSTLTVTASAGYQGTIRLSCAITSAPTGSAEMPGCAIAQNVTLSSSTAIATTSITVNTAAAQTSAVRPNGNNWPGRFAACSAWGLILCMSLGRRRMRGVLLAALCAALLCGGLLGCGSRAVPSLASAGNYAGSASPGVYIYTVTGVGSDVARTTATTSFSVTVE